MEFDLKIINRVSIFHDFQKRFIINRVRVSRSGGTALPKLKSSTLSPHAIMVWGTVCRRIHMQHSESVASLPADYYSPSLREVSHSEKLVCRVVILMASRVTLGRLQSCIFNIIFTRLLTNQRGCKNECHDLHFDVH